jgi:hypothetical protein
MPKIANLSADLVANTTKFEADLKRADRALASSNASWKRALTSIDKEFAGLGSNVGSLTNGIFSLKAALPALAVAFGAQAIASFSSEIRRAIDAVGGLGEVASQVGVTTDTLQAFDYAATQVGLSTEEMRASLTRLTRVIGDAATGNKAAIDTFNALGVGVLDFQGNVRPTEEVLRAVANSISQINDPARRASVLVDLLGKSGQKLAPLLEDGAGGIDALVSRAKNLGLVFDDETIKKADKAADAIAEMGHRVDTLYNKALLLVGVPVAEWLDQFSKRGASFAHDLLGDDTLGSIQNLQDELDTLRAKRDSLAAEAGNVYIGGLVSQEVAKLDGQISDLERRISKANSEQGQRFGRGDALAFPGTNPLPKETGTPKKTPAETQAENLAKKIADLQLQVDTFDMSAADQQIATALAGIDQGLLGAKEAVTTISALIQELNALKVASEEDKAAVAEFDKIIADADAAWQKRVADGKALTESLQTPLEAYEAKLSELKIALDLGTISQDDFNRATAEAKDALEKAEKESDPFREFADSATNSLAAGLADAVVEADNFNDSINDIIKSLAKMALAEGFKRLFQFGLDSVFGESATGGPEGGLTLVGERGPELVNLPAGSFVTPAMSTSGHLAQRVPQASIGGGGMVVTNNINIEGGAGNAEQNTDLVEKMQTALDRSMRNLVREEMADNQRSGGLLNSGLGF